MYVKRNCNYTPCSKEYQAEEKYLKRGQGLYCSMSCSGKQRSYLNSLKPDPDPNTSCGWCQVPLYIKPSRINKSKSGLNFCCVDHQNLAYKDGMVQVGPEPENEKYYCPSCNKKRTRPVDTICVPCRVEQEKQAWLAGDNNISLYGGKQGETKKFVKRYLIETRGDKCEECGFNEVHPTYGTSIIQMDHIDGNSRNNNLDNLKLLCPNHHAMTDTYGSRNKGSGRAHRRKDSC